MTADDGSTLNYDVHVYAKNEIVREDVVLQKVDDSGQALANVDFALYYDDGTAPFNDNVFTTDTNGEIRIDSLSKGKYYFEEVKAPERYATNNKKIYFEVLSNNGENQVFWTSIDSFVSENGQVINYGVPEIEKDVEDIDHYFVDRDKEFVYNVAIKTPGDIHKYKTLGVTDILDERLEFVTDGSIADGQKVSGTYRDNISFSQEGQTLKWSVKDLGELRPKEDIKITFTAKIKPSAELGEDEAGIPNDASLDFDNDRGEISDPKNPPTTPPVIVTPKKGGLKIIKVDKSDPSLRLEGAEFKITMDKEGNNTVIVDANVKVNGETYSGRLEGLTTGKSGEILIENLSSGTYYLHETKAPMYRDHIGNVQNYQLLTRPVQFTIGTNTEMKELVVENSKSRWEIPRTGGLGTIIFTTVGVILIIAAIIVFARRRKQEQEEQALA